MAKNKLSFFALFAVFGLSACNPISGGGSSESPSSSSESSSSESSEPSSSSETPYNPDLNTHYSHYAATEATCTRFGNKECWIKDNGAVYLAKPSSENIEDKDPSTLMDIPTKEYYIEPLGHKLAFDHYKWALDHESAEAYCACQRAGCDHEAFYPATVNMTVVEQPSCIAYGSKTYTATFQGGNIETTDPIQIPMLDHEYTFDRFEWDLTNPANPSAEAVYVCGNGCGHEETHPALVASKGVTQARTCYQDEITTFRATYLENAEDKPVTTAYATHHEGTTLHTGAVEETCSATGNIEYWNCTACGDYFDDEEMTHKLPNGLADTIIAKDASKHNWGTIEYTLDPNNYENLSATRVCKNDSNHVETKTVANGGVAVTSTDQGATILYHYTFDNPDYEYADQVFIKPVTHTHTLKDSVPAQPSTCSERGHVAYYTCNGCSALFLDSGLTEQITDMETQYYTAKLAHTPGTPVTENENLPTCTTAGSHDTVTYCTECHQEISRVHHDDAAINHAHKVHHEAKEAKCYEVGNIEYWYCPDCGKYFDSAACTPDDEVDYDDVIIPKTDHNLEWHHDDTYHWQECTNTGCNYATDPDVHTPGEEQLVPGPAPTCVVDGYHELVTTCTTCSTELSRNHVNDPATTHAWTYTGRHWNEGKTLLTDDYVCSKDAGHTTSDVVYQQHINYDYLRNNFTGTLSELVGSPTAQNKRGDINLSFANTGSGTSYHVNTTLRITRSSDSTPASELLMLRIHNGSGYSTSHVRGNDYVLIRADYTASHDSNSGGYKDVTFGTNKATFDATEFATYMKNAVVNIDFNYVVNNKDDSVLTVTITYYSLVDGAPSKYLGYVQTYVSHMTGDTDWTSSLLGGVHTVAIARPTTDAILTIEELNYSSLILDHHVYNKDDQAIVNDVNHSVKEEVPAHAATCQATGNVHYYISSQDDMYFLDDQFYEKVLPADVVTAKLPHSLEYYWYEAESTYIYHCKVCDHYYSDEACTHEVYPS